MSDDARYSMLIQWSDRDRAYLVRLPDWERDGQVLGPVTHGDTYEEAVGNGREVLELLIEDLRESGDRLPEPGVFVGV